MIFQRTNLKEGVGISAAIPHAKNAPTVKRQKEKHTPSDNIEQGSARKTPHTYFHIIIFAIGAART
jgi:hypothetical protein